ncbi:MAG: RNA polymerase sigma factor SigJ [Verrucomicrobiota bacterium]
MPISSPFESYRSLLQGIAYRMLGSVAEAEDIVQETYLKFSAANPAEIQNLRSWLVTVCSRLSLDRLKSAQRRRETYVGPWLPEPLLTTDATPATQLSIDDTVSTALLYTLERLSPSERAAFILHDIFEYSFDEISEILNKTPAACRKLASRARTHAQANKPRYETTPETHQRLIDSFFKAIKEGDFETLEQILAEDVTFISDGGGKAIAARKALEGIDIIAKFFIGINKQAIASNLQYTYQPTWYNGAPALLLFEHDQAITAFNLHVVDKRIQTIFAHRNPDKLALLKPR